MSLLLLMLILNLLLLLLLLRLGIGFELLEVLHQMPEVLSKVLQQVVLHRLVCLELVQQAGGLGVVVPVLLVDHHVARGVQGLLHLGHRALDLGQKKQLIIENNIRKKAVQKSTKVQHSQQTYSKPSRNLQNKRRHLPIHFYLGQ